MKLERLFWILIAATGICLTLLFPPNTDVSKDYTFFWNVPKGNIDVEDMTVRLVIFAAVPGILFFIFRDKKTKNEHRIKPWIPSVIIIFLGIISLWLSDRNILDIAEFLFWIAFVGAIIYYSLRHKKLKDQQKE